MSDFHPAGLEELAWLFLGLPPLVFLLVGVVLLALVLWVGKHAWVSLRIVMASRSAPLADLRRTGTGLVKLCGKALPPPAKPGFDESSTVWRESIHSHGSGRTTSRTVGQIRIQHATGICVMNVERAKVVPTTSKMKTEFLARDRWKSSGEIRRGDAVFALGALHGRNTRRDTAGSAFVELRPAAGVLLLSGASEFQVQVQFGIWLLLQGVTTLVLLAALLWGSWIHVGSYPPGSVASIATFIDMLLQAPFDSEPGISHPAWPPAQDQTPVR